MKPIKFIRGATFSYAGLVKLPVGTWTASGSIKTAKDTLVSVISVTLLALEVPDAKGNTHSILLEVPSTGTSSWPIATLSADLSFSDTSSPPIVLVTSVFNIAVQDSITL